MDEQKTQAIKKLPDPYEDVSQILSVALIEW